MIRVIKYVVAPAIIFVAFAQGKLESVPLACLAVLTYGILLISLVPDKDTDQLNP